MSADPHITLGDLVWVAKPMPCCGRRVPLQGDHFVVSGLMPILPVNCMFCVSELRGVTIAMGHSQGGFPVFLLEKVPPLNETERLEATTHE